MSLSNVTTPLVLQGSHFPVPLGNNLLKTAGITSIDSSDNSPDDVHIIRHKKRPSQPLYFTSYINEGFSNVEEVTCDNNPYSPNILVQENQLQENSDHIARDGNTGCGVQYGHQMGQTSTTVSLERHTSIESTEESEKELLIATPLDKAHTVLEERTSPLMLSIVDTYDAQRDIYIASKEFLDDSDSNEGLYPIISDESGDGFLEHLPDIELELDTESEPSFRRDGNIPNLEALGVTKVFSSDSPASYSRSLSTLTKNRMLPISPMFGSPTVMDRVYSSDFLIKRLKSYELSARSPKVDKSDGKQFRYCTTSTQSAIVEKIRLKQIISADDDDDDNDDDDESLSKGKTISQLQDSDESSITSRNELVESNVDTAFKESVRERSMLPILKEELKLKIQVERMKRGEPEAVLQADKPKKYQLRQEEIVKKAERLRQNRDSARRSRIKANAHKQQLEKKIKEEMNESVRLRQEIRKLRVYRAMLRKELDDHLKVCTRRQRINSE